MGILLIRIFERIEVLFFVFKYNIRYVERFSLLILVSFVSYFNFGELYLIDRLGVFLGVVWGLDRIFFLEVVLKLEK